jgi:dTDP-4-amino-4,6-dideoxygalactose transaminase
VAEPIPYGHQSIDDGDVQAVVAALRSDWLTMGPLVGEFEAALTAATGAAGAVAVSNGTAALHTAYAAMRLVPGDEVIVPPLTFVATAAGAALHGATIRFADVEADTGNIDPDAAAALVGDRTRAITGVDYAGHPIDADALAPIATAAGALLVEDAAHSIGSTYRGRPVGGLADVTTFSFFPTKNLTTAEGGAVVASDPALLERARRFRSHGTVRDPGELRSRDEGGWWYEVQELGLNYRLPDVLCALGLSQLARLAEFKAARARIFARYVDGLADLPGVTLPSRRDDVDPTWHLFPLRIHDGRRRHVYDALRAEGVLVQVNYIPVYWHPYFEDLGYRRGLCPVAELFYAEELSLPMFAGLGASDQDRVIELVRRALV